MGLLTRDIRMMDGGGYSDDGDGDDVSEKKMKGMTEAQRRVLVRKEVKQLENVVEHEQFSSDPLSTIREHITNSIALQHSHHHLKKSSHPSSSKKKTKKSLNM
eukprot:TRINITY_DN2309_c0_g1_i2.p1 TRINITY_DN2309_c0_g1~~TRINITY_DN2309_c0_g1_i2.p1  ORF type:complete len:103 (+),score=34.96 TRINITY_DN2309_c0_g1_i2:186-494(+)